VFKNDGTIVGESCRMSDGVIKYYILFLLCLITNFTFKNLVLSYRFRLTLKWRFCCFLDLTGSTQWLRF
jgi:hypothetical protein